MYCSPGHSHRGRRRRRRPGQGFGFFGGRRFFGPGEVRLALLSLLADVPMHGYELMKQLEARSGGTYRASAGTIYPTLQQLEDEGLVDSQQENGKRVYRLTDAGRAELEQNQADVRRIWRRAESWGDWEDVFDPDAWELTRPTMRLVKAAFRAVARGEAEAEQVRAVLDRARREIEGLGETE